MLTPVKRFLSSFIEKVTRRNFLLEAFTAFVVAISTSVIGLWIFRDGPRAIFGHKLPLAGDGALLGLYIKLANQRTFMSSIFTPDVHTSRFGWPGQLDFSGYPMGQTSELIMLRLLRRVTGIGDVATLMHIVSVLKVVPIALAVLLLARMLKLPRVLSMVIAVSYSISTFNLVRSEGHFFLALTWSIPLGLAAIYLAFQASMRSPEGIYSHRGWRHYASMSLLLILVAFSGFYFILFMGMLATALMLPVALSEIWSERSARSRREIWEAFCRVFRRISSFVYVLIFLLVGLLYQTVPILIEASKSITLTGIADRSPIESVVYAGNLDSFFYDSSSLFLRIIKRQDLLNFISTRISWEGSQLGATAGLAAYLGISYFLLILIRRFFFVAKVKTHPTENVLADSRFMFVIYLLVVAFVLYISSPFNFAVSRILPEVRAWGRMSLVLTLLILYLLALLVSKIWDRRLIAGILTLCLLGVPMVEAYFFRQTRPTSIDLSSAAQTSSNSRVSTLAAMKGIYAQNCPIFLAPVYPFPEFDRPDDSNIDYAELDLPMTDSGYFRWSYPAVKDTTNWAAFQPLISEQPPFPRASLNYQLSYARALGACGAVIDRTLLIPDELKELTQIETTSKACFENLPGETFLASQRFASLSFAAKNCGTSASASITDFAKKNLTANILWRVDSPGGLKYIDKWQVFAGTSPIDIRFIKSKKTSASLPIYSFLFTPVKGVAPLSAVKVCYRKTIDVTTICQEVTVDSKGEGSLTGDASQLKTSLQKYEFTIAPESTSQIENWGLVVGI